MSGHTPGGGGPAFPTLETETYKPQWGMSLRDYFAIHCDQPGQAEIVETANLVWSNHQVWHGDRPDTPIGPFDKWWTTLSLSEKYQLYAKVRYSLADAMLAERSKSP